MLRQRFQDALKASMKDKNQPRVSAVRLIIAKLKERDIDARGRGNAEGIPDAEIQQMLQGMVKQRRESIELYEKGNRKELADQERGEIAVIEEFLPRQMDEATTEAALKTLIAELGAAGPKDMGRVMAALKERYAGQMDMSRASAAVKKLLTG
jgi:uncharacterized protein YqeY